jgi:hypothetical protein
MNGFIQCPFCAGHEKMSPEAVAAVAYMIRCWLNEAPEYTPVITELMNIRNDILNRQERVDPLLR